MRMYCKTRTSGNRGQTPGFFRARNRGNPRAKTQRRKGNKWLGFEDMECGDASPLSVRGTRTCLAQSRRGRRGGQENPGTDTWFFRVWNRAILAQRRKDAKGTRGWGLRTWSAATRHRFRSGEPGHASRRAAEAAEGDKGLELREMECGDASPLSVRGTGTCLAQKGVVAPLPAGAGYARRRCRRCTWGRHWMTVVHDAGLFGDRRRNRPVRASGQINPLNL